MKEFIIPKQLTPVRALNCASYISNCEPNREYVYDFSQMQHCHPFGLLLVGNAIRKNKQHYQKASHTLVGIDCSQGTGFASEIGFFQYAEWDVGRKTSLVDYGSNYIPVKRFPLKNFRE